MKIFSFNMLGLNLDYLNPIVDALNIILWPLVGLLATAGTIYAIVLGVNMAKADNPEKRSAAKKRIIGALTAVVSVIILLFLLKFILENLNRWVNGTTTTTSMITLFIR